MENQVTMDYFDRQIYWPYYLVKVRGGEGISMVNIEYNFKSFLIPKMFLVNVF